MMGDIHLPRDTYKLQERFLNKLKEEIANVDGKIEENVKIRQQMENVEDTQRLRAERQIEKLTARNMVLQDELERIYTKPSPPLSPAPKMVITEVITKRTKEFSDQQHEKAMQYKYLLAEKQRLQQAQERLREKRLALHRMPTPEEGGHVPRPVSIESAHSNASLMHRAVADMPYTVDRIYQLKEHLHHEYVTKQKPYRGELGIDSYQPWQIDHYVFIRKFVSKFLDDFVNKFVPPDYSYVEQDVRWMMEKTEDGEWQRTAMALAERKAVQLVAEAILLQETRAVMRQTAAEVLHVHGTFKNMTDLLLMREAESISTGAKEGRDSEDPAYNLITKSFFTSQQNRSKFKKDIWSHSQPLQLTTSDAEAEEMDDMDTDVELITYSHLHPADLQKFKAGHFDLPPAKRKKEAVIRYRKREAEFWTGIDPGLFTIELPNVCDGVLCVQPSPDGTYVAMGTANGDVLVYDVRLEPWRLGRIAYNNSRNKEGTVDVSWSLDGTRIVSVHEGGKMQVWGLEGPALGRLELRALQLVPDEQGNMPKQLGLIGTLDVENNDFTFQLGPMAESEVLTENVGPVKGSFYPSFSLFGVQHQVCGVLENGDIMKVNLEILSAADAKQEEEVSYPEAPLIYQPNIYDESHGVNLVGQNLEAELFRQHKHPVMHIGFVDNISRMVTVDDQAYINIWNYDPTFISGFGYFMPEKKYKLDFNKTMYTPSNTDQPKVVFTDSAKSNTKTQAEIARDRNSVQNQLDNMNLGDPWHEEIVPDRNLVTSVYAPKGGVKDSGAMFNIVLRHENTQQLSIYLIRMYKPVKVKCSKLLAVEQTPSGRELVFVLLFPEYPPKEPHMMILILDLMTMKLRDLRRDIYLTTNEHDMLVERPIISFSTTRVLAPTGAEYLFIVMQGRIRCISLTTGNLVLRAEDPKRPSGFTGCLIDEKFLQLSKRTEVTSLCFNGRIYAALHEKALTTVQVLQLNDNNGYEGRRLMWKAYQTWDKFRRVPPEVRVDKVTWLLSDMQHSEVDMRRLILELVDKRVFGIREGVDEEGDAQRAVRDKTEQYNAVLPKIEQLALLDGPHKA
ncbi:uncharacterized protein [Littorina saxatilis]|uniref:Uncharacterized protein n=1 Tax=Littorina saxatilis TaxID=31220 RepID=A0AAN9ANJ9_9CAEN